MWWAQLLNNIVSLLGNGGGAANSYESIATVTVGAGGAANVTFSGISSAYKHLQIRGISRENLSSSGYDNFYIQFNSDTGSNYARHLLYGDGSSAGAVGEATKTTMTYFSMTRNGDTANVFGAAIVDILDYSDTNKYKTVRGLSGADGNGSGYLQFTSGLWQNTSAVSTITIAPNSGSFVQYTQFALYGVK